MRLISFLVLSLTSFATGAVNLTYTPCVPCLYKPSAIELEKMELRLYTGPSINDYLTWRIGDALELFDKMNNEKPTVVLISALFATPDDGPIRAIVDAYLARADHNVVLLDWRIVANRDLILASRSTESVGYTLATSLNKFVERGLNISGFHIVGHSIGAQIAGYTGRFANFRVPRITGLDPAGYGFYIIMKHLSSADAESVFIIHTDGGVLGHASQTGHADFYPNNGVNVQPGCPRVPLISNICSHYRSCYYYAESVRNGDSLTGISCATYSKYQNGLCNANPTAAMGFGTPVNARGRYYLQTNSKSPYGKTEAKSIRT